jgi:hypothetical protein
MAGKKEWVAWYKEENPDASDSDVDSAWEAKVASIRKKRKAAKPREKTLAEMSAESGRAKKPSKSYGNVQTAGQTQVGDKGTSKSAPSLTQAPTETDEAFETRRAAAARRAAATKARQ